MFLHKGLQKKGRRFPSGCLLHSRGGVCVVWGAAIGEIREKQRVHETLSLHHQVGGGASQWVRRIRLAYQEIYPKLQIETTFKFKLQFCLLFRKSDGPKQQIHSLVSFKPQWCFEQLQLDQAVDLWNPTATRLIQKEKKPKHFAPYLFLNICKAINLSFSPSLYRYIFIFTHLKQKTIHNIFLLWPWLPIKYLYIFKTKSPVHHL